MALRQLQRLNNMIELKSKTYNEDTYSVSQADGYVLQLAKLDKPASGLPDRSEREGSQVFLKSIALRWQWRSAIDPEPTNVTTHYQTKYQVRAMIVYDRKPQYDHSTKYYVIPTIIDMLNRVSTNSGYQWENERNKGRFLFLYDKTFMLPSNQLSVADKVFIQKNLKVEYKIDEADGGAANIVKGALYFVILANDMNNQIGTPDADKYGKTHYFPTKWVSQFRIETHVRFTDI